MPFSKKQKKGCRPRMAHRRAWSYGVGYDTRPRRLTPREHEDRTPDRSALDVSMALAASVLARKFRQVKKG